MSLTKEKESFELISKMPITEWQKKVDDFFSSDFAGKNFDDIKKEFDAAIGIVPIIQIGLSIKGDSLWRVRCDMLDLENPSLVSTYSYPPPNITQLGRANIKGTPVFYCNLDAKGALAEAKMNNASMGWLTEWIVHDGLKTDEDFRVGIFADKKNSNLKNTDVDVYQSFGNSKYEGVRDHIIYLFDKVGHAFTSSNYALSSFFANQCIFNPTYFLDGLIYPSVIRDNSFNIAFHPNFVQHNLRLKKVTWFVFKNIDPNSYKLEFWAKARVFGSHILHGYNLADDDKDLEELRKHL